MKLPLCQNCWLRLYGGEQIVVKGVVDGQPVTLVMDANNYVLTRADVDVSVVCKARGGGGHRGAAGFEVDSLGDLGLGP